MLSTLLLWLIVGMPYCTSSVSQQPWDIYGTINEKQVNENTINQYLEFDQDGSISNDHQEIWPFLEEGENSTTEPGIVEGTSNTFNYIFS